MTSFNEMADRFGTAEIALNLATQRLVSDKERRRGSLVARFVDFVSETEAEEGERKTREEFNRISDETRKGVAERMNQMAMAELSEDPNEASRRATQAAACERTFANLQQAERLSATARNAHDALTFAASACSSASSMEMMDAFTSNKAISAMSSMSTSSAKTRLNTAVEALKALSEALPGKTQELGAEAPDDFLDLVLDFADFPIDFLSWMNMGKLDAAEEKCKAAAAQVAKLLEEIGEVEARKRQAHELETDLLAEIDRPYLLSVLEYVPQSIRFAVPEHLTKQNSRRDTASPRM